MKPKYRIEIFRSKDGGYCARVVSARNGKELWRQSETYKRRAHCVKIVRGFLLDERALFTFDDEKTYQ